MTGGDLVREALAELYSSDPDEFTQRRAALVARARAAGDAPAAKRIGALRRPTRSAWVLNRLARSGPGATSELDALGEELRAAHRSLDGAAIRELSSRRRELIDALARQAFAVSGLPSPPSEALRVEVRATLGAALADPQVAEQLAAGTLERAARGDGFGSAGPPELTLVTSSGEDQAPAARAPAVRAPAGPARSAAKPAATSAAPAKPAAPARAAANVAALAAARERMERERRRSVIAESQEAAAAADRAASAAASAEREQENVVRLMEQHLADARRDLADARRDLAAAKLQARAARTRQLQARQALDRLQE